MKSRSSFVPLAFADAQEADTVQDDADAWQPKRDEADADDEMEVRPR
jgi:hypothetical protein